MKRLFYLSVLLIVSGALVTFFFGDSGQVHLRRYSSVSAYEREDGSSVSLPFTLRLSEFKLEYYPDSNMPKDYVSQVSILPDGVKRTISMNHILKWKGYRFFQADYDPDLQGSILSVSHDPWGVRLVYTGYVLLLLYMLGWFVRKDSSFRQSAAQLHAVPARVRRILWLTVVLLLVGVFILICRRLLFKPLMPVLRSNLLWIHIASVIISYSIFALVAVCGIWALLRPASRERLMQVSGTVLYPAVFFQSFGIIIGSVWANISWGAYWSWDPKETWALITLLIYLGILLAKKKALLKNPPAFHVCCVLAFLSVLFTYFGVNLLLGGLHAYA